MCENTESLYIDLHTHTMASGHGTEDTITDLAREAARKGMKLLGISDHGPATPGSCRESYFRGLRLAPREREGVRLLYGVEANILDLSGRLDMPAEVLSGLDFCIASIHPQTFDQDGACQSFRGARRRVKDHLDDYTEAYIGAMQNPYVRIIGHPDDQHYPIDCERLVRAAAGKGVAIEINEASLAPDGYRGDVTDTADTDRRLLSFAVQYRCPVLLSSDSHGAAHVGEASAARALAYETGVPSSLILNDWAPEEVCRWLSGRTRTA